MCLNDHSTSNALPTLDPSGFNQLFCLTGPQTGRPTALAASPCGRWLWCATSDGDLTLINTADAYTPIHIRLESHKHVTAVDWVAPSQALLSCVDGAVHAVEIPEELGAASLAKISFVLRDIESPIRAMAFDKKQQLLALGYSNHVSVWNCDQGFDNLTKIDFFSLPNDDLDGQVNALAFFGTSVRQLFIGAECGNMIWTTGNRIVSRLECNRRCRAGAVSLSPDGTLMAVSTLDQTIVIWPLSSSEPLTDFEHEYVIESGRHWHMFQSRTPLAFTSLNIVVSGTLDGTLAFLTSDAVCQRKLSRDEQCSWALVTHETELYAAFTGAVGVVSIVGYSNDPTKCHHFRECGPSRTLHRRQTRFYRFDDLFIKQTGIRFLKNNYPTSPIILFWSICAVVMAFQIYSWLAHLAPFLRFVGLMAPEEECYIFCD